MPTKQETSSIGWALWFQWVLANIAGWVLSIIVTIIIIVIALLFGIDNIIGPSFEILSGVSALIIGGATIGAMQWLVLRPYLSQIGWWVLASTLGVIVGLFIGIAFAAIVTRVGSAAIFGVVIGTMQWLVLRRHLSKAGWWVLASGLGEGGGAIIAGVMIIAGDLERFLNRTEIVGLSEYIQVIGIATMLLLVMAAVNGAVTGISLVWLLRNHLHNRST